MEKNPFVKEKTKDLIIITSIISTLLIGVLFTQLLNGYDKYMVYSSIRWLKLVHCKSKSIYSITTVIKYGFLA